MITIRFDAKSKGNLNSTQTLAPESFRVVIKALQKASISGDPDAKQADRLAGLFTSLMKLAGYYMEED